MAKPHTNQNHDHHLAAVLLVFLLLISSSSSSARLLNDFSLAATEPTLNLALPSDGVVPEKEKPAEHVSPCDHMGAAGKLPSPGVRARASDPARLTGGKYGTLILSMLPKGTVPPSGPSKGTNNLNN